MNFPYDLQKVGIVNIEIRLPVYLLTQQYMCMTFHLSKLSNISQRTKILIHGIHSTVTNATSRTKLLTQNHNSFLQDDTQNQFTFLFVCFFFCIPAKWPVQQAVA